MFESSTKKASIPLGLSSCEEPILPYFCGEALQRSEPQASRKGAKHAKVDVIWCGNEWYADLMQSKLRRNLTQRRKARKEECLSLDLSVLCTRLACACAKNKSFAIFAPLRGDFMN